MQNQSEAQNLIELILITKSWTQDELAEALGVSQVSVSRWKRGKKLSADNLEKLRAMEKNEPLPELPLWEVTVLVRAESAMEAGQKLHEAGGRVRSIKIVLPYRD